MKKIFFLLIIALFFIAGTSNAQTPTLKSYEKAARKALAKKDFYSAWKFFEIAYEIDSSRYDNLYNLAESARQFKSYNVAQNAYEAILKCESKADYPDAEFWLADVMQSRENYDGAIEHFENFLGKQITPKGPTGISSINYSEIALKRIDECNWAKKQILDPRSNFTIASLGSGVNTPASEFAPVEHQDEIYYSALGYDQENFCPDPNKDVSRLYTPREEDGQISKINWAESEDKSFIAHTAFNTSGSRIYFTRCKRTNAIDFDCAIYYIQEKNANGKWDERRAVRLPANINLPGTTNTQPNIGYDDNLGKELLLFTSDRVEGGVGGRGDMDIYCSIIEEDGTVSAPVRLDMNTDEDDITPFYNRKENTIYFSSKGYRGFGGFDIYKSQSVDGKFVEVEGMDYRVNTSYDDVYFSMDVNMDNAYFSSNRLGVTCEKEGMETCCNDIFKLDYIRANLLPFTYNGLSNGGLDSCSVTLYDITTGEQMQVAMDRNLSGYEYTFPLDLERDYMVIATHEGRWTVDTTYVSTKGVRESTTFKTDLNLFPSVDLISMTFDSETEEPLTGCTFILRDGSGNVILETNRLDDNRIYSMLEFGKQYSIQATKDGYEPSEQVVITTEGLTTGKTFNVPLYLGKEELPDFGLSISLYFDNDEPDKRTRATSTNRTYEETYLEYSNYSTHPRIEDFVKENSKGLYGEAGIQAGQDTRDFFKNEVDLGMQQLKLFATYLEQVLPKGGYYEVDVEGYASPRAPSDYNEYLTARRISSVENYLRRYKGGMFAPYIDSNKLKLKLTPFGEVIRPDIPSRISDPKSIYSIEASKQRRVRLYNFKSVQTR